MLNIVLKHTLAAVVLLALGLPGSLAMATEEPKFEIVSQHGHIELRRYAPFIVAETFVEGDRDAASGKGFRAIADYIFGNNVVAGQGSTQGAEKIAMTVPVTMEPADAPAKPANLKIAMTAPVALEPLPAAAQSNVQLTPQPHTMQGANRWRVHFVMPSAYTLETR